MDDDGVANTQTPEFSLYEQSRELRIKENLERMQKLGIVDLSLKLKSSIPPKRSRRKPLDHKNSPPPYEIPPAGPRRRSSRLQNATPVSYSEVQMEKKNKSSETEGDVLEEGAKPEVYSDEHEKLLGNTEKSWMLFVDGYGKDGKRIYDPVKGKTCHQCRQKTLGHRTHCSNCNMVQGQFCGDCLYMRYGEHVLEAQQNPNWICPVCRGICNCSLCRQAKGWRPTGTLYKKITRMGFKSVAHFLIQTRRSKPSSGQDPSNLVSAKRSLIFIDSEVIPAGSPRVDGTFLDESEHDCENNAVDELENKEHSLLHSTSNYETKDHISSKRSLNFLCPEEQESEDTKPPNLNHEKDELRLSLQSADYKCGEDNDGKEKELECLKAENDDNHCPFEAYPMPEKKLTLAVESNTDTTAGRLRNKELAGVQDTALLTDQSHEKKPDSNGQTTSENLTGQTKLECGNCSDLIDGLPESAEKTSAVQESADSDSIYGRLRKRQKFGKDHDGNESPTIKIQSVDVQQQNKKKKPTLVSEPRSESIGRILRPRLKAMKC